MSNLSEFKINSINPEDISEIDPKTISFLTLVDGTILTVEQTTPIKQKRIKPPPLTITKEYNFLILNNRNSQINILDKNKNICLNDNCENELDNSKKKINDNSIINDNFNEKNNFLVNKDEDEDKEINNNNLKKDKDLSLDASNSILQLNDFNETNKTLYNIFYGFSNDKKVKRKNILQINKNNIINNKPLIIRDKLNNNRIKNQRTVPSNKDKDSAKEFFNKKSIINKKKNFRQLIEEKDNFKSIIKNNNLYKNKKVNILKLNFYENQKDSNVSMKFNKLVNKLKMNRIHKTSDFKNYINSNGSKSGFFSIYNNTNKKRYGNEKSPYLLNNIRSSPNYSFRKSNNLN